MIKPPPRLIFTVARHKGGWAVQHGGAYSDASINREEVMASASRRARAASAGGALSQVVIEGETGYFGIAR
jgi:hypothetical protein